jgi:hypothetical protein
VNGVKGDNAQTNTRVGATFAIPVQKAWAVKASYSTGIATRFGADFDRVIIGLQYRWGGGP